MKKTIILLTIPLLLASCTNKWDQSDPNMPEELRASHQETLQEHLEILKEDEKNTDSLLEVAFRYDQLGDFKKAEKYYKKILEIDAFHFPALNNLANIYEKVEEYDLAAEQIKTLYENYPTNIEVLRDAIRMLLKADEPEDAKSALDNYVAQVKNADETLINDLNDQINTYLQEHEK